MALEMRDETEELNAEHATQVGFLRALPETKQKFLGLFDTEHPEESKPVALKNHLMVRRNYEAMVSGDGACAGMNLGYLVARLPYGPPFTLDQAYPFVRGARIAMGFPDILLEPQDAFARAFQRLETTRADLVLGLYRMRNIQTSDMIDVDPAGRVHELIIRPSQTTLTLGWMFAVWTPRFTEFLHEYLAVPRVAAQHSGVGLPAELTVGQVIQAAIRDGLDTQSVVFMEHDYLDIGTTYGLRLTASDAWSGMLGRKADSSERSEAPSA